MTTDPDNPETLARVPSDIEAAAIVTALAAAGIEAATTGGYTAGFRAEAPGDVNVIVRFKELDKARKVLEELRESEMEIDWSRVNVGEPES